MSWKYRLGYALGYAVAAHLIVLGIATLMMIAASYIEWLTRRLGL